MATYIWLVQPFSHFSLYFASIIKPQSLPLQAPNHNNNIFISTISFASSECDANE